MKKGNIVLVPFPFTDLSQTKLRPAVVLYTEPTNNDITLCFITSQGIDTLFAGEFLLDIADPEFSSTGLKVSSKVRVTRMMTIDRKLIARRLGTLGNNQIQILNSTLVRLMRLRPYFMANQKKLKVEGTVGAGLCHKFHSHDRSRTNPPNPTNNLNIFYQRNDKFDRNVASG
jgi:mRNA interferase MazF